MDREKLDAFQHLRVYESNFDSAQSEVRRAAALWIIAAIGAYSFVIVSEDLSSSSLFSQELAGLVVSGLGATGMFLLWLLDQRIYQELLHSVFAYGLAMEKSYPHLPQVRTTMFALNLNISRHLALLYLIPMMLFIIVGSLFITRIQSWDTYTHVIVIFVSGVGLATFGYAIHRTRKKDDLITEFGKHFSQDFRSYFRSGAYLERLKDVGADLERPDNE